MKRHPIPVKRPSTMKSSLLTFTLTSLCVSVTMNYLFITGRVQLQHSNEYDALYETVQPVKLSKR